MRLRGLVQLISPTEPPPSRWGFSLAGAVPGKDLVGVGADLAPGTLLAAYRAGVFPMGLGVDGGPPTGWWSPDPRGVLLAGDLQVSRSLRRSSRRFTVTVDHAFEQVVGGCAVPARPGRWITAEMVTAYQRLHRLGWAHSVEVWEGDDPTGGGRLAGGLYGLGIGRLFAAESKFHRVTDASKVALLALVEILDSEPGEWAIDVQWRTPHLARLGVREVPRSGYLDLISWLVTEPLPTAWVSSRAQ